MCDTFWWMCRPLHHVSHFRIWGVCHSSYILAIVGQIDGLYTVHLEYRLYSDHWGKPYILVLWFVVDKLELIRLNAWILIFRYFHFFVWCRAICHSGCRYLALATYIVDDQNPLTTFSVPSPSELIGTTVTNVMLFQTEPLLQGQHKIVVTYLGNSATVPIIFNYCFVQQDTSGASSSSDTPSTSTSVPSGSSSISSPSSLAIISGVVSGSVLIHLITYSSAKTRVACSGLWG